MISVADFPHLQARQVVSEAERVELENELSEQIDESDGDRVRVYRLCESCLDDITDIGSDPPSDQSNVI